MGQTDQISPRLKQLFADGQPSRWVTRERPKNDSIACPWLNLSFLDPEAHYSAMSAPGAASMPSFPISISPTRALPYLPRLYGAQIRTSMTSPPQASGLHALSVELKLIEPDYLALLKKALVAYDTLQASAHRGRGERHNWTP